jgi:transposase
VIQVPKLEPQIMRYELSDHEWAVIKPMLPNKPRGVARVNDRRVLNGIFWVLRSGAPWRDLPEGYGPPTNCYNRFDRWLGEWRVEPAAFVVLPHFATSAIDEMVEFSIEGPFPASQYPECVLRQKPGV